MLKNDKVLLIVDQQLKNNTNTYNFETAWTGPEYTFHYNTSTHSFMPLRSTDYKIDLGNSRITITDALVRQHMEYFQVCKELDVSLPKYSANPEIDKLNKSVQEMFDLIKNQAMLADSKFFYRYIPKLNEDMLWVYDKDAYKTMSAPSLQEDILNQAIQKLISLNDAYKNDAITAIIKELDRSKKALTIISKKLHMDVEKAGRVEIAHIADAATREIDIINSKDYEINSKLKYYRDANKAAVKAVNDAVSTMDSRIDLASLESIKLIAQASDLEMRNLLLATEEAMQHIHDANALYSSRNTYGGTYPTMAIANSIIQSPSDGQTIMIGPINAPGTVNDGKYFEYVWNVQHSRWDNLGVKENVYKPIFASNADVDLGVNETKFINPKVLKYATDRAFKNGSATIVNSLIDTDTTVSTMGKMLKGHVELFEKTSGTIDIGKDSTATLTIYGATDNPDKSTIQSGNEKATFEDIIRATKRDFSEVGHKFHSLNTRGSMNDIFWSPFRYNVKSITSDVSIGSDETAMITEFELDDTATITISDGGELVII